MQINPPVRSEAQEGKVRDPRAAVHAGRKWEHAAGGFAIGGLLAMALIQFKLDQRSEHHVVLLAGIGVALLALTRLRRVIWFTAALVVAGVVLIGYTPLAAWLTTPPPPGDRLEAAPAIVVLGTGWHVDGTFNAGEQDRVLEAFRLLRAGYSPRIVLPGAAGSWAPSVREHMRQLGLDGEVDEALLDGPILNTHDEALAVSRLCRQRGWDRVILVTHAWHMRRSAALFEKASVRVLRAPCNDSDYDEASPDQFKDRVAALRDWIHEQIGYHVYHWRGWI